MHPHPTLLCSLTTRRTASRVALGVLLRVAIAFGLLLAVPSPGVQAQAAARNALVVEANPFRGSISLARRRPSGWETGLGVGFGIPQIDVTLAPRGADYRDYAHLGAWVRRPVHRRAVLEVGVRAGIADFEECTASDCWPGAYLGPSALLAVGGDRWKVGARLTGGMIWQGAGGGDGFLSLSPLNLVFTGRW